MSSFVRKVGLMFEEKSYLEYCPRSFSFETLKQELKDKDEMIYALKKKLEIMESFNCSSSSFDALNSFQKRRNSSVVVLAENEPIPSPTFKSLRQFESSLKPSKRGSKLFQRQRNHTTESSLWCSQLPLNSAVDDDHTSLPSSKSVSILPIFKQVFTKSLKKVKKDDSEIISCERTRKRSFFKNIFFWKREETIELDKITNSNACSRLIEVDSASSCFKSLEDLCPTYSYEEILSGNVPLSQLDIDRIEKYLKWDDCIEFLGVTKEQLKLLRSNSLTMRKRSVFLCADQLKHYYKAK